MHTEISVIIPAYNNIQLFKLALNSVLKQREKPNEIIVVDDSSSDQIESYCNNLNNSILRYYHNRPSLGAINNWNYGISLSKSDYIILLHHDEELSDPNHISRIKEALSSYDVVVSNIKVEIENHIRFGKINDTLKKYLLHNPISFFCINSIGPCACVAFKRALFQPFDNNLTWIVDTEWYYRLLRNSLSTIYLSDLCVLSHHGHKGQITNNINIKEKDRQDKQYLLKKYSSNKQIHLAIKLSNIIGLFRRIKNIL